jgi:hypothetical protein
MSELFGIWEYINLHWEELKPIVLLGGALGVLVWMYRLIVILPEERIKRRRKYL